MPGGVPVATFAIGAAGAKNAALFAAAILANESCRDPARRWTRSATRRPRRCSPNPIRASLETRIHESASSVRGQLGRMLALAGYPLGIRCLFLDRSADAPGRAGRAHASSASSRMRALLAELAGRSDVLTFDWENISGAALAPLGETHRHPPAARGARGLPGPAAREGAVQAPADSGRGACGGRRHGDLVRAVERLGLPGVLKTRRMGYDGKGQFVLRRPADVERGLRGASAAEGLIYERFQPFSREVSIVGARSADGGIVFYPLSANTHADGMLSLQRRAVCEPAPRARGAASICDAS